MGHVALFLTQARSLLLGQARRAAVAADARVKPNPSGSARSESRAVVASENAKVTRRHSGRRTTLTRCPARAAASCHGRVATQPHVCHPLPATPQAKRVTRELHPADGDDGAAGGGKARTKTAGGDDEGTKSGLHVGASEEVARLPPRPPPPPPLWRPPPPHESRCLSAPPFIFHCRLTGERA